VEENFGAAIDHRVTRTITDLGMADGYFANAEAAEVFYDELTCFV